MQQRDKEMDTSEKGWRVSDTVKRAQINRAGVPAYKENLGDVICK